MQSWQLPDPLLDQDLPGLDFMRTTTMNSVQSCFGSFKTKYLGISLPNMLPYLYPATQLPQTPGQTNKQTPSLDTKQLWLKHKLTFWGLLPAGGRGGSSGCSKRKQAEEERQSGSKFYWDCEPATGQLILCWGFQHSPRDRMKGMNEGTGWTNRSP